MRRKPNPKPSAALAEKIEVEFVYESPTAKEVFLAGDFNNWSVNNLPMRKNENGVWRLRLPLTAGRHEYRYVVDGEWQNDHGAFGYVSNELGSFNCVVEALPKCRQPIAPCIPPSGKSFVNTWENA